jgi:hypothetical protein
MRREVLVKNLGIYMGASAEYTYNDSFALALVILMKPMIKSPRKFLSMGACLQILR